MTIPIIAEIGSNWDPAAPMESWSALINMAALAGATHVKGQDWHPLGQMNRSDEWKERCRPWTMEPALIPKLKQMTADLGLGFLCSAFTSDAVDRAARYEYDALKLASSELTNQDLLVRVRAWKNPLHVAPFIPDTVYLSLGEATTEYQVTTAISRLAAFEVVLMACIAEYPVGRPLDLLDSLTFALQFGLPVGLSSHVAYPDCLKIARTAVKRGAVVVEAHLRVDGVSPENAPDNGPWALRPEEFKDLVQTVEEAYRGK